MSKENRTETAITKHSSNGLMRVENAMGITQKILTEISSKGFQFNYKTVKINGTTYLAENLRETHFRNGDPITEAKSVEHWKYCVENKIPAFCYYDNEITNDKVLGKLYNCYCLLDKRRLIPIGWEIFEFDDNVFYDETDDGTDPISEDAIIRFNSVYSGVRSHDDATFSEKGNSSEFWCNTTMNDEKSFEKNTYRLAISDLRIRVLEPCRETELGADRSIRFMKSK